MTEDQASIDKPTSGDRLGVVVLCGGHSRRMGFAKAQLPFGNETLLQRILRRLGDLNSPMVVVHASGQELPALGDEVLRVADAEPDQGPLRGIACGLSALAANCDFAFVTGCDVPFISGKFVRRLDQLRERQTIAMLIDERRMYPLCAIYSTRLGSLSTELLANGTRRPIALLDQIDHKLVAVDSLQSVDPELESLININAPSDYREALERAGLGVDPAFLASLKDAAESRD